jgi:hypothetical protein
MPPVRVTSVLSLSLSTEVAFVMGRDTAIGSAPASRPDIRESSQEPRLRISHQDSAHIYGVCSVCEHRLHAFIRNTEQQARLLLNRGFKQHCRGRHEMVVSVPTKVSTPRRSTRIAADVLIEIQGERFAYAGETITVNLHGALVRIAAPLKLGDRITCTCMAQEGLLEQQSCSRNMKRHNSASSLTVLKTFGEWPIRLPIG